MCRWGQNRLSNSKTGVGRAGEYRCRENYNLDRQTGEMLKDDDDDGDGGGGGGRGKEVEEVGGGEGEEERDGWVNGWRDVVGGWL